MPTPKRKLVQLIAQDRLPEAFEALLTDCEAYGHPRTAADVALQSAAHQRLRQQARDNVSSATEQEIALAKVRRGLLDLVNDLPDDWPERAAPAVSTPHKAWAWRMAGLATAIAVLAGLVQISGYSLHDFWEQAAADTTTAAATDLPPAEPIADTLPPAPSTPPQDRTGSAEQAGEPIPNLAREAKPPPAAATTLALKTDRGTQNLHYREGETLRLYVRANSPCHLRLIYRLADGQLILLADDRTLTPSEAGRWVEIGAGFEVSAPLGEETLYAFAQDTPFEALQTREEDGYRIITSGLPEALRTTRGLKPKALRAETTLFITTSPNS